MCHFDEDSTLHWVQYLVSLHQRYGGIIPAYATDDPWSADNILFFARQDAWRKLLQEIDRIAFFATRQWAIISRSQ